MKLKEYDIAVHLKDENEIQMYLNDILKDEDPVLVLSALDDIARARKEWTTLESDESTISEPKFSDLCNHSRQKG